MKKTLKDYNSFQYVFNEGNVSEIDITGWQCGECGEILEFNLSVDPHLDVEWVSVCCRIKYTITPFDGAYNFEKL